MTMKHKPFLEHFHRLKAERMYEVYRAYVSRATAREAKDCQSPLPDLPKWDELDAPLRVAWVSMTKRYISVKIVEEIDAERRADGRLRG